MGIVEQEMHRPENHQYLAAMEKELPLFFEHLVRVAKVLQDASYFMDLQAYKREIVTAGLLHDVGKIRHPDIYAAVQRPLTGEERIIVREHPRDGFEMLKETHSLLVRIPVVGHQEHNVYNPYPRTSIEDHSKGTRKPKPLATRLTELVACADQIDRVMHPLRGDAPYSIKEIEAHLRDGYLGPEECVKATLSAVVCSRLGKWV